MGTSEPESFFCDDLPRFSVGQLVRHRRYGYRGIVVDFDMRCRADENWYQSNRTQPDRHKPWYHVLVDGSTAVTYAAEANLASDDRDEPVHNPLVPHLFDHIHNGRYARNDTPWPGWDGVDSGSETEP